MGRPPRMTTMSADEIQRELEQERKASMAALHTPLADGMHRRLSDEELMMRDTQDEKGPFEVDADLVPDGMVYQWFRTEVFGKPDNKSITGAERNGWRAVPTDRHPGVWLPDGATGPIEVEGQRLMELPETEAYNRTRTMYLRALQAKRNGQEMLGRAPQGTGPRNHPGVRPTVHRTVEPLAVES